MQLTQIKKRAIAAIRKAKGKGYKLREISESAGVSIPALSNVESENYPFSEKLAARIIDGCKNLRRAP